MHGQSESGIACEGRDSKDNLYAIFRAIIGGNPTATLRRYGVEQCIEESWVDCSPPLNQLSLHHEHGNCDAVGNITFVKYPQQDRAKVLGS